MTKKKETLKTLYLGVLEEVTQYKRWWQNEKEKKESLELEMKEIRSLNKASDNWQNEGSALSVCLGLHNENAELRSALTQLEKTNAKLWALVTIAVGGKPETPNTPKDLYDYRNTDPRTVR